MTTIDQSQHPMYEAREHGGTWDIVMRIPHASGNGGCTVERILIIDENAGVAPDEATIARRTEALLNMSAHIDTEDLFIKGATLKLQTFSEAVSRADMTDRERDLSDTCQSMRLALKVIGKTFGVSSSDPQMIAAAVTDKHSKMCADYSQVDRSLNEHSEAISQLREHFMIQTSSGPVATAMAVKVKADESAKIAAEHTKTINELRAIFGAAEAAPNSLLTLTRNAKENADLLNQAACDRGDAMHTLNAIREALEVDPDYEYAELPRIAAELFENLNQSRDANKETAGQLAKADQELAMARGERDMAHRALKEIQRVLGVVVEDPKELPAIITKLANDLTSVRSTQTTLDPFKREVMALCMIKPSTPDMLPSLPELLIGIRDYVNTITRYRGGAMILHDLACQLTGTDNPATDAEPYANIPWQVIADRLEEKFYAPRNAIATLIGNYELEVKDDWRDNVTELYTFLKGLSVAQHKHDELLQTLLTERAVDRSIIGAIDDVLGDTSRPAAPLVAAVRALVRSHLIAIERS